MLNLGDWVGARLIATHPIIVIGVPEEPCMLASLSTLEIWATEGMHFLGMTPWKVWLRGRYLELVTDCFQTQNPPSLDSDRLPAACDASGQRVNAHKHSLRTNQGTLPRSEPNAPASPPID